MLAKSLFFAYDAGLRRRPMLRYLRDYERQQWLSPAQIEELQVTKLRSLLSHASAHVPHSRSWLTESGLKATDFNSVADLSCLPVMTKDEVRAHYSSFLSEQAVGPSVQKATGGSTGDPFQFEYSRDSEYHRLAVMWRGYRWAGADIGRRSAYIWSWPYAGKQGWRLTREVLYQRLLGRTYFNIFALSDAQLPQIAQRLIQLKPETIVCYVSGGVTLARWLLENRVKIPAPRAVITGAEPLHDPERELLSDAFGAPVFNTYGGREFMLMASECPTHQGLHISADNLILETVDDSGKPVRDRVGRVLITDLHNLRMPFIRYANGDLATIESRPCSCGRGLPLLTYVEGREADVIRLADGRRLTGLYFVHFFKDFPAIRYYQVVQKDLREICVRIVPVASESQLAPGEIQKLLQKQLGEIVRLSVEQVEHIPQTRAGKRRIVESRL